MRCLYRFFQKSFCLKIAVTFTLQIKVNWKTEDGFNLGWSAKLLTAKFHYLSAFICITCKAGVSPGRKKFRHVSYSAINCSWFELKTLSKSQVKVKMNHVNMLYATAILMSQDCRDNVLNLSPTRDARLNLLAKFFFPRPRRLNLINMTELKMKS